MKKKYIYKINVLVNDDVDNVSLQHLVDETLDNVLTRISQETGKELCMVSCQLNELTSNDVFGQCEVCGEWVSDMRSKNSVNEFSNGAIVNNKWYCDLCLPENHKNHF